MKIYQSIKDFLLLGEYEKIAQSVEQLLENGQNDERFLTGELLFSYGFFEEAEQIFKKLLTIYPNEGELLTLLAEILTEKGETDEAILLLEKVNSADDAYPQALLLLADLYESEGLAEVAEQKLLEVKQILQDEKVIDYALGKFYQSQGKYLQALAAFEIAITDENLNEQLNINENMAEILSNTGQFEEALPYYKQALANNLEINTLFKYGVTALQAGHNKLAIKKLTELKQLDYEYHSLYLFLAEAYENEGLTEQSLAIIEKGLALDEFNKELYFFGGQLKLKLLAEADAEQYFRQAIALDPTYNEAVIALNKLLRNDERFAEILSLIDYLGEYGEENPQYIWDQAYALEKLERYSEALNKYEVAYTFFKDDEMFLNDYGYFLIEEGKTAKAVEVFKKLLSLNPTNEQYIDILDRLTDI